MLGKSSSLKSFQQTITMHRSLFLYWWQVEPVHIRSTWTSRQKIMQFVLFLTEEFRIVKKLFCLSCQKESWPCMHSNPIWLVRPNLFQSTIWNCATFEIFLLLPWYLAYRLFVVVVLFVLSQKSFHKAWSLIQTVNTSVLSGYFPPVL